MKIAKDSTLQSLIDLIKSKLKDLAYISKDGVNSKKFLRGDGTWQNISLDKMQSAPLMIAKNPQQLRDDGGIYVSAGAYSFSVPNSSTYTVGYPGETSDSETLPSGATGIFAVVLNSDGTAIVGKKYIPVGGIGSISVIAGTYILCVYSVESEPSIITSEITDGGSNVLSDKYDATSYVNRNERYTISSSNWSANPDSNGYYTNTITTVAYNTYAGFFVSNTGASDGVDATSAEAAAFNLVNKFYMPDGTGATSLTLYAKTKPTTTFYIRVKGTYMAKNAASSTKALDITTGCKLTLRAGLYGGVYTFDGSTERLLRIVRYPTVLSVGDWSSVVNANGYYTLTNTIIPFNTYMPITPKLKAISGNTPPTAAEIAAYNLIDYLEIPDGTASTTITAYAKTKPTTNVCIELNGFYIE